MTGLPIAHIICHLIEKALEVIFQIWHRPLALLHRNRNTYRSILFLLLVIDFRRNRLDAVVVEIVSQVGLLVIIGRIFHVFGWLIGAELRRPSEVWLRIEGSLVLLAVFAVLYQVGRRLIHINSVDLILLHLKLLLQKLKVLFWSLPLVFEVGPLRCRIDIIWRHAVPIYFTVDAHWAELLGLGASRILLPTIELGVAAQASLHQTVFFSEFARPPRPLLLPRRIWLIPLALCHNRLGV